MFVILFVKVVYDIYMGNDLQIGKLYRCSVSRDILAIDEGQYQDNIFRYILRTEKLYSFATTFSGAFDLTVLKPNTVFMLLDIVEQHFAGTKYIILKCLIEDRILYVPFSEQRFDKGYINLLEYV